MAICTFNVYNSRQIYQFQCLIPPKRLLPILVKNIESHLIKEFVNEKLTTPRIHVHVYIINVRMQTQRSADIRYRQ